MAWPFLEPVNPDDVPEYNDVIADPIGKSLLLVLVLLGHRLVFFLSSWRDFFTTLSCRLGHCLLCSDSVVAQP